MRIARLALFLVVLLSHSATQQRRALVVISINGLRPDYVLKADEYELKIPHLRKILVEGAHASGLQKG
jgi:predicted AlkP superfamily pyrophosphatase or phosphodiesterase